MLPDGTRQKIENIVRGIIIAGAADHCTTTRNFLCGRFDTSKTVKTNFESQRIIKKEQEACLKHFASKNNLWITDLPEEKQFIARGGESQVYLATDQRHVIKINDGAYYATWLEYFNSLVLHNSIFSDTAYVFIGFAEIGELLMAVVRQPFIISDSQAMLDDIKEFLDFNGFQNTKRQDYYNSEYGLILEDMHDENVISKEGKLFFIDTVFYTVDPVNYRS